jgi:quercetin dioxygenase-like cupin family protein
MRFMLLLVAALLSGADHLAAQERVEMRGITPAIKLDEVVYGHLPELNGKFRLRATEVTFAPDGYLGVHHHVGPGIRYVLSGELSFTQGGQTTIYRAGDYFFETGNLAHTAENKANQPLRILFVEILPRDWAGPTVIPPKR